MNITKNNFDEYKERQATELEEQAVRSETNAEWTDSIAEDCRQTVQKAEAELKELKANLEEKEKEHQANGKKKETRDEIKGLKNELKKKQKTTEQAKGYIAKAENEREDALKRALTYREKAEFIRALTYDNHKHPKDQLDEINERNKAKREEQEQEK